MFGKNMNKLLQKKNVYLKFCGEHAYNTGKIFVAGNLILLINCLSSLLKSITSMKCFSQMHNVVRFAFVAHGCMVKTDALIWESLTVCQLTLYTAFF